MPESNVSRITNQAAVTAVRATLGKSCSDEMAVEIIEVVRPHLESPLFMIVKSLRKELAQAREEIARLEQTTKN